MSDMMTLREQFDSMMLSVIEMRSINNLVDDANGTSAYQTSLIALALVAREFLRRSNVLALLPVESAPSTPTKELLAAREDGREQALRALASATRKVLSPELVALVEAEMRRGLARDAGIECGNWTPQKANEVAGPSVAPAPPADEEIVAHAFTSRTPYKPGDDRDIWCKDCEYHRDHQIHAAGILDSFPTEHTK